MWRASHATLWFWEIQRLTPFARRFHPSPRRDAPASPVSPESPEDCQSGEPRIGSLEAWRLGSLVGCHVLCVLYVLLVLSRCLLEEFTRRFCRPQGRSLFSVLCFLFSGAATPPLPFTPSDLGPRCASILRRPGRVSPSSVPPPRFLQSRLPLVHRPVGWRVRARLSL